MATLTRKTTVLLNDAFPEWLDGKGIFTALNAYDVPWKTDIDPGILDIEYHGNYSGSKTVSPLVARLEKYDHSIPLSAARMATLANVIYKINSVRWDRLWETIDAEYNPIHNYDMHETEVTEITDENTVLNTGTVTHANTGTVTNANTGTVTNANTGTVTNANTGTVTNANTGTVTNVHDEDSTGSNSGTDNASRYAFNSSSDVNTAKTTTSGTATTATDVTDTRTDNTTETRTDNTTATRTDNTTATRTDNTTETRTDNTLDTRTDNTTERGTNERDESRTLTRSGNIGVTSTMQLLTQERELDIWNIFYSVIFPDIDKVLTIATYSDGDIYHGIIHN